MGQVQHLKKKTEERNSSPGNMRSSLVVGMLVVTAGAMAVHKPALSGQTVVGVTPKGNNEEPKPCKSPKYYTLDEGT